MRLADRDEILSGGREHVTDPKLFFKNDLDSVQDTRGTSTVEDETIAAGGGEPVLACLLLEILRLFVFEAFHD